MPCGAVKCMKTCYFRPKYMTLVQKLSHICKISPPPFVGTVVSMHVSVFRDRGFYACFHGVRVGGRTGEAGV